MANALGRLITIGEVVILNPDALKPEYRADTRFRVMSGFGMSHVTHGSKIGGTWLATGEHEVFSAYDISKPLTEQYQRDGSLTGKATKSRRGFATWTDKVKQREVASAGGKLAHELGTAHEFTSEEASQAGRIGGAKVSRNREHMAEIGRKGGRANSGKPRTSRAYTKLVKEAKQALKASGG